MVSYAFYVICYFNRCGVKAENEEGTEKKKNNKGTERAIIIKTKI